MCENKADLKKQVENGCFTEDQFPEIIADYERFKLTDEEIAEIIAKNSGWGDMISDVLFDAIAEIERYQNDPVFRPIYDHMKDEIKEVKEVMRRLMEKLDAAP